MVSDFMSSIYKSRPANNMRGGSAERLLHIMSPNQYSNVHDHLLIERNTGVCGCVDVSSNFVCITCVFQVFDLNIHKIVKFPAIVPAHAFPSSGTFRALELGTSSGLRLA